MSDNSQVSFLTEDNHGHTTIFAEYRVNKRERPMLRTMTETKPTTTTRGTK